MDTDFNLVPITSFELLIPRRTAKLLYFSDKDPQDISCGLLGSIHINLFDDHVEVNELSPDEPSIIFMKLPIRKPDDVNAIERPCYYPTYAGLNPEQRWIYLNWLKDPSKAINVGYVFLYYYGLERQLLLGEFDLAMDEMLYLRKYHHHGSFVGYSNTALLSSCIFRKRLDRLKDLGPFLRESTLGNMHLLFYHHSGYDLAARDLMDISKNIKGINRRYLDKNPDLFEAVLDEVLIERYYKGGYFPFYSGYKFEDIPRTQAILFANTSFPSEIRSPDIADFFAYEPFTDEVQSLFKEAHERIKLASRKNRKA